MNKILKITFLKWHCNVMTVVNVTKMHKRVTVTQMQNVNSVLCTQLACNYGLFRIFALKQQRTCYIPASNHPVY